MFEGYLLSIDGTKVPDDYILSYDVKKKPIVVNDYYDAYYDRHIIYAPKEEVSIVLELRKMKQQDFFQASGFLKKEMEIIYFDSDENEYKSGIFTCKNERDAEMDSKGSKLWLKKRKFTFVRKREIT